MDPPSFIRTHVDVVVRGLLVRKDDNAAVPEANCPLTKRSQKKT